MQQDMTETTDHEETKDMPKDASQGPRHKDNLCRRPKLRRGRDEGEGGGEGKEHKEHETRPQQQARTQRRRTRWGSGWKRRRPQCAGLKYPGRRLTVSAGPCQRFPRVGVARINMRRSRQGYNRASAGLSVATPPRSLAHQKQRPAKLLACLAHCVRAADAGDGRLMRYSSSSMVCRGVGSESQQQWEG